MNPKKRKLMTMEKEEEKEKQYNNKPISRITLLLTRALLSLVEVESLRIKTEYSKRQKFPESADSEQAEVLLRSIANQLDQQHNQKLKNVECRVLDAICISGDDETALQQQHSYSLFQSIPMSQFDLPIPSSS